MLSSIFSKSLYERRWSTLIWFLTVASFTFLTMLLFPSLRDSLGASLQDVPESMQNLLGSAEDYQNITGFVDLQIIAQMIFLTVIMGIITGTAMIAGEENSGTLQTLLAQPVKRSRVYVDKLLALFFMTGIVSFGIFIGVGAGAFSLGESIDYGMLLMATGMVWLLTLFFASMAYSIGAITGKRGVAGVLAGAYAFVGYMLTALAGASSSLEKLNYASPFYYFNQPSVIKHGLDFGNVTVLVATILFMLVIGLISFNRRDIYQK